jgi:AraC-like DNA-binding protein
MTTNVHALGDLVLRRARPSLLLAHAARHDVRAETTGRWRNGVLEHWSLDWAGPNGFDQWVEPRGQPRREFSRPPRSWGLIAPGTSFGERFRSPEPRREFLYLGFRLHGPFPPLTGCGHALVLDPDDRLAPLVRAMAAHLRRGSVNDAIAAHGLLLQILAEVALSARGDAAGDERSPWQIVGASTADRPPELLDRVDALLLRSLSAPPSRRRLAAALAMSESALAHRFRAETGMGLRERARWLRVREAKARLADPDASVKSVARGLGFVDQAYFTRVFRTVTGMTPQEFQRRTPRG